MHGFFLCSLSSSGSIICLVSIDSELASILVSATLSNVQLFLRAEFPPKWVGNAIDKALAVAYYLSVAGAVYLVGTVGVRLVTFCVLLIHALFSYACECWVPCLTSICAFVLQYKALEGQSVDSVLAAWARLEKEQVAVPASSLWVAGVCACLVAAAVYWWRKERIFLLDFECYRPHDEMKVSYTRFLGQGSKRLRVVHKLAMDFQEKILHKSALSEETFCPPALHMDPPRASMVLARGEAELVMYPAVANLLQRTGLHPRQIDILVVNCSLFNPTPSLSAMIINHFKMRSDIESYNLGGMGCSAGVISIGLARKASAFFGDVEATPW